LAKLDTAINIAVDRDQDPTDEVDELLQEGLIQRFEYTHELAWNLMKDYLAYQGYTDIRGPRDAIRRALEEGLVDDARWMETISDRNLTSHNYDKSVAADIYRRIVKVYYPLFISLEQKMQSL
jgi:nucleotidyltransferase substrate binding protein (TIGR01987 family)